MEQELLSTPNFRKMKLRCENGDGQNRTRRPRSTGGKDQEMMAEVTRSHEERQGNLGRKAQPWEPPQWLGWLWSKQASVLQKWLHGDITESGPEGTTENSQPAVRHFSRPIAPLERFPTPLSSLQCKFSLKPVPSLRLAGLC